MKKMWHQNFLHSSNVHDTNWLTCVRSNATGVEILIFIDHIYIIIRIEEYPKIRLVICHNHGK